MARKHEIPKLPRIFKDKHGTLYIVYRNRVEVYELDRRDSKSEIDAEAGDNVVWDYEDIYGKGWNHGHEIDMLKNNGFREVHAGKTETFEVD